jgi:hypothetical protein
VIIRPPCATDAYPSFALGVILKSLDRAFLILFARARRVVSDARIAAAWQTAMARLGGYLVFPVIALMILAMLVKHLLIDAQDEVVQKAPGQVVGIIVFLICYVLLYKRYRAYMLQPPALALDEPKEDQRYLTRFRTVTIGAFFAMLLLTVAVRLLSDSGST